jgi:hypothetical protein
MFTHSYNDVTSLLCSWLARAPSHHRRAAVCLPEDLNAKNLAAIQLAPSALGPARYSFPKNCSNATGVPLTKRCWPRITISEYVVRLPLCQRCPKRSRFANRDSPRPSHLQRARLGGTLCDLKQQQSCLTPRSAARGSRRCRAASLLTR